MSISSTSASIASAMSRSRESVEVKAALDRVADQQVAVPLANDAIDAFVEGAQRKDVEVVVAGGCVLVIRSVGVGELGGDGKEEGAEVTGRHDLLVLVGVAVGRVWVEGVHTGW